MIKELIVGILTEEKNKVLNTKRIKNLAQRIAAAVVMIKSVEDTQTKQSTDPAVDIKTVESKQGNRAIVAVPEAPKKAATLKNPPVIIAFPDGNEVTPYKIDFKN